MPDKLRSLLCEPTNAKIIWLLRESPLTYSQIMACIGTRDSGKTGYHLRTLTSAGLLTHSNGKYSLTPTGLRHAIGNDLLQMKEQYPLPVVVVAILQNNMILLGKRNREPYKNFWGLPGNEILTGESVTFAAVKEVEIELGVHLEKPKFYGVYPTQAWNKNDFIYHVMLFAVKSKSSNLPLHGTATGKLAEYRFFSRQQLKKIQIIPSNAQPILDAFTPGIKLREQLVNGHSQNAHK